MKQGRWYDVRETSFFQKWQKDIALQTLLGAFSTMPQKIRFIGGCVRDALLGKDIKDVDFVVSLEPKDLMALLREQKIPFKKTGLHHGTVMAIIHKTPFEITSLRKETAHDGRHARVSWKNVSWLEDAKRRDFTINAMQVTHDGWLWDPFDGLRDLAQSRLRFIGDADKRLSEDFLRAFRYLRFWGYFPRHIPTPEEKTALQKAIPMLDILSVERCAQEGWSFLKSPGFETCAPHIWDMGLWEPWTQRPFSCDRFKRWQNILKRLIHPLDWEEKAFFLFYGRYGVLFGREACPWPLAKQSKKILKTAMSFPDHEDPLWVHFHTEYKVFRLWIVLGLILGSLSPEKGYNLWNMPKKDPNLLFPVTGHDLCSWGFQGRDIGEKLSFLKKIWLHQDPKPTKQDLYHQLFSHKRFRKNIEIMIEKR